MPNGSPTQSPWVRYYVAVLIVLGLFAVWSAMEFEQYTFNEVSAKSIATLLTPLFVIAVFVERAQEVFVTTWRGVGRATLETALAKAKQEEQATGEPEAVAAREAVEHALEDYKAKTKRIAFISGISLGVLISVAGVRVLYPLLSHDLEYTGTQQVVFGFVDVFLTGGLIGGGSDGIHKVMSTILDFIDLRRKMIKKNEEQLNQGS